MLDTILLPAEDLERDSASLDRAAEILKAGGLVAIPTETVYGLAANALEPACVAKIYTAKGRPSDNPLIVHVDGYEMVETLVAGIPPRARAVMEAFWPGPLTIILPKSDRVPLETTGGLDTVAIRMPAHPVARELIRRCALPLAAPSANLSGSPSTTSAQHCVNDLTGRVDAILDGGECQVGLESTVLTLATPVARILRPGAITREMLLPLLGEVELDPSATSPLAPGTVAASPGMKYKHYAPKAKVYIVQGSLPQYAALVGEKVGEGAYGLVFTGEGEALPIPCLEYGADGVPEEQAHHLFAMLRQLDEMGAHTVYARSPSREGVGLAVYNRLLRAAGFSILTLEDA